VVWQHIMLMHVVPGAGEKFGLCIFMQQIRILANSFCLLIHESSCDSARCFWSHRRLHKVTKQNVFILVIFVDRTF
jgi:hypothetical protein